MEISLGIVLGLLTMIGFGLSNAFSRIPAKELGGLKTIFYRGMGLSLVQVVLVIFLFPRGINLRGVGIASIVAIFSYLPIMFFYKALQKEKVGLVSPIANSSAVVTALLAMLLFGERLMIGQWVGGLLVLLGIVLISVNFKDFKSSRLFNFSSGVPFAILACFGWGITFFLFKYPVTLVGPVVTSFIVELVIFLMSGLHMKMRQESFALPRGYGKYLIPVIIFSVMGPLAYNYGIQSAAVSFVVFFYMANPMIAALYARIFYKETLSVQQYAAIVFIIMGVLGVSLLK